jgi:alkylation response protein AidB-like acyl-CoA dehydrogenase
MTRNSNVDEKAAAELVEAARALKPLVFEQAEAGEAAGRLTDATVAALSDAGLFNMWSPREFGGAELWPVASLEIIEALSHADGSTGWVLMASGLCIGTGASYLAPDRARELFDHRLTIVAGHGAAMGRADVEGDGFRLSGNWSYASGLLHAGYIHTGGIVYENGEARIDPATGEPEFRVFVLPVAEATFKGNWDVLGLRATGSIDYSIDGAFVPAGCSHLQHIKVPNIGGDLYKLGIFGFSNIGHTGFALGVGRRLLDELAAVARAETGRPFVLPQRGGGESFQEQYGSAEAAFRAARALVYQSWREMEDALREDGPIPTRRFTMIRLALNHVTTVAADIAQLAFAYGGGGALRNGVLQRNMRDMLAGAQHAQTSPQILRECAKDLMGMAEGKVWTMRFLVDPR